MKVKRALLSVYRKDGVAEFARGLAELGVELISTGGTARCLEAAGLTVTPVQDVTGSPELLDGRVKTLHPRVHAGVLARRDLPDHMEELAAAQVQPIDLVVVNLYPFSQAVADPTCTLDSALENIDIGGPTMLRAAAKNFLGVIAVCNPQDYQEVLNSLSLEGDLSLARRRQLAMKAFAHTAHYDQAITQWLIGEEDVAEQLVISAGPAKVLRYGENPHQKAALYREADQPGSLAWTEPLQGKELSYNNYNDADAALALVSEFSTPAAVAVKHAVPCGVGMGDTSAQAFTRARQADPVSIFGGIIAFNHPVDGETATLLREVFLEVVIAPQFTAEAREVLAGKKNLRLLECSGQSHSPVLRSIYGGYLVQQQDQAEGAQWQVAGQVQPQEGWQQAGQLAWLTAKYAKSNAIVVANSQRTLGIGSGSTSRIDAANFALAAAKEEARGAVLASDGFIPFPDVVDAAAQANVAVIIQPGGSKGDKQAIQAADEYGIAMIFTGMRHFRH